MLLQTMRELAMERPNMITDENVFSAYSELLRALDMRPAEAFVNDPRENPMPPQPPPPDPKVIEVQEKAKQQQAKDQMDHDYRMKQAEDKFQIDLRSTELAAELDRWKAEWDIGLEVGKFETDDEISRFKANNEIRLKGEAMDAKTEGTSIMNGSDLEDRIADIVKKQKANADLVEANAEATAAILDRLEQLSRPRKAVKKNGEWVMEYVNDA